ncbi:MAG: hypothetical protein HY092_02495 [Candidatus Kerfeldbacteria bacterium]|nr:hypothetical protein [Candidatus Kerfeldbacteria bacterium]
MKKFIILYNGPATPADKMTPDMVQKVMNNWKTWMGKVGSSMLDMGQPMAPGKAVVDDGTMGTATLLSGYSIIQAECNQSLVSTNPSRIWAGFLKKNPPATATEWGASQASWALALFVPQSLNRIHP